MRRQPVRLPKWRLASFRPLGGDRYGIATVLLADRSAPGFVFRDDDGWYGVRTADLSRYGPFPAASAAGKAVVVAHAKDGRG